MVTLGRSKDFGARLDSLSFAERYSAFLLLNLPILQACALRSRDSAYGFWRGQVLQRTVEAAAAKDGVFLEFGVFKGASIKASAERLPSRKFYGFDSFEGFPDDGRDDWDYDFSVDGIPEVPSNVSLIKGFFSDTLEDFLSRLSEPVAMIHIDCDIYSSTSEVLRSLHKFGFLRPGLIICFDELINYRGFMKNEMLALFEVLDEFGLGVNWLCCHERVRSIEEAVQLEERGRYPSWQSDLELGYRQQASLQLTSRGFDYAPAAMSHLGARVRDLAERANRSGLIGPRV